MHNGNPEFLTLLPLSQAAGRDRRLQLMNPFIFPHHSLRNTFTTYPIFTNEWPHRFEQVQLILRSILMVVFLRQKVRDRSISAQQTDWAPAIDGEVHIQLLALSAMVQHQFFQLFGEWISWWELIIFYLCQSNNFLEVGDNIFRI